MIRPPFRSAPRGTLLCTLALGASLSTACSADNGPVVVDGGSLFDTGALDGALTDAGSDAVGDIVSPPRDGGPAVSCTVSPSPAPFANPRNVLHWRASATTPFAGSEHVISTPVVADIVPEGPDDVASVEIAFMTWACPYQDMTMPGV